MGNQNCCSNAAKSGKKNRISTINTQEDDPTRNTDTYNGYFNSSTEDIAEPKATEYEV